jgi:putative mycofactocin binding protein MftB
LTRKSLRPEPFGALAYHYGTRRLVFLKDAMLGCRQWLDSHLSPAACSVWVAESLAEFAKAFAPSTNRTW